MSDETNNDGMGHGVAITSHSGSPAEEAMRARLLELLEIHDVERWLFTREVLIRSGVAPHSHPILTLNTRQLGDDAGTLGTFLHEQFHWHATANREAVMLAVDEFRPIFPGGPVGAPEGARDEFSSYLHLVICTWELEALCVLFGEERARNVIAARGYYTWIYDRVLQDGDVIGAVMARHGLVLP